MQFSELGLSEKVLRAVEASGYTTPTPIQAQAIPLALAGRDVLGIAQTGTGKTAAFALPMLRMLEQGRARARMPRTLILEPTRELAAQVEESFDKYGIDHKLNVALLIGGVSFDDQETKIMRGADVLIATPGRLLDFFERGKLLLNGIEILVIDEADRMLDMGFIPDIEHICKLVPFTRQTLFFSATMPPEITRLTEQFLHNPVRVEVARAATTAETITQALVASHGGGDKRETLRRLMREAEDLKNAIVFCNRKRDVAIVHKSSSRSTASRSAPAWRHGPTRAHGLARRVQERRRWTSRLLRRRRARPRHPRRQPCLQFRRADHSEDYVHRIGRTGRAGRTGHAYTIVTSSDSKYISQIEDLIKKQIEWDGVRLGDLAPAEYTERDRERASRSGDKSRRGGGRSARSDRAPSRDRPEGERGNGRARPSASASEDAVHVPREEPVRPPRQSARAKDDAPRASKDAAPRAREDGPRVREDAPRRKSGGRTADDDAPVIGMGDHVPSFLLRPVKVKSAKTAE